MDLELVGSKEKTSEFLSWATKQVGVVTSGGQPGMNGTVLHLKKFPLNGVFKLNGGSKPPFSDSGIFSKKSQSQKMVV